MKVPAPARITLLAQDPALNLSRDAFFSRSGATQKGRILEAATHVVAEHGYAGATVQQIVRSAGVSRTTFYELFTGKKECLLASYEVGTHIVLALITEATTSSLGSGWRAAFEAGLDAYLDTVKSEPEIARAHFVELGALGTEAVTARIKAQEAHADAVLALVALARDADRSTPEIDHGTVRLLVAGIEERVAQATAASDPHQLDDLRVEVLRMVDHIVG